MEIEIRNGSDDGYGTDASFGSTECPTKCPIKCQKGDDHRLNLRLIQKDSKDFRSKYFTEKVINNSANGIIYQGYRTSDKLPVCIKQVPRAKIPHLEKLSSGRQIPIEFKMQILASEACQGVVKVLDWYERKTSFVLIMEKPQNSIDLFEFSRNYGAVKEQPAKIIFRQIVKHCIEMKNKCEVLHRDLKDENILISTKSLEVKIIDFGCATKWDQNRIYTTLSGTPEFFPPEIFKNQNYLAEKSTVWSLGTLLYILVTGDVPFDSEKEILNGKRTKFNEEFLSIECRQLLNTCLNPDQSIRCTLDEILNSHWLIQE